MRQSVERKRPALAVALTIFLTLVACSAFGQHFNRTDLTANSASVASVPNLDPNLVNAWGLSRSSGSPWWVSDNGTGLSTLYDASGMPQSLVVTIPSSAKCNQQRPQLCQVLSFQATRLVLC